MIYLDPIAVTQGDPFTTNIAWVPESGTTNMAGWSGIVRVVKTTFGDVIGEWPVDVSVAGTITVSFPDTSFFPSLARIGSFVTCTYEITITGPGGAVEILQGSVAVAGRAIGAATAGGCYVSGDPLADVEAARQAAVSTAADRVQTGLDRAQTEADAAATADDATATAADRVQTSADRVQTMADAAATAVDADAVAADRVATEAARDAAFAGANVYPDTAAGLAAVAANGQFMVPAGDRIIRYREDAGPVATPVAEYPSAAAVDARATLPEGAPAYMNPGGQGDRTASITVSVSSTALTAHAVSNLVDGATANNTTDSVAFSAVAVAAHWIMFDFGPGAARIITEATWKQSGTQSHGSWKWQVSDDAATWVDAGAAFTLGGATAQVQTVLASRGRGYRFYRLLGVSGTASGGPFIQEVEFKITAAVTQGLATRAEISPFPAGFPVAKLVAAYWFDEATGTVVRDVVAGRNIDLTLPTTPNVTLTAKGAKLAAGLIQTPVLPGVRSQTVLYRTNRGGTAGYIVSGGAGSGSGTTQQNITATEGHKLAGFGLDPFTPLANASGGACWALNRGGWAVYHREDTAARDSAYGLGGRHSTTTSRCAEFEANCAFFWNATLTTDELAAVYLFIRQRAARRGIWLHRADTPVRGNLFLMLGESNCDGRALITDLSAADQVASYRHTMIGAGDSNGIVNFDAFELGYTHKYPNSFGMTVFGPELGIATERRADRQIIPTTAIPIGPAIIAKNGKGGTRLAPSSVGGTTGTTWSVAEAKDTGLFWLAWNQSIMTTLQQSIEAGFGWQDTVKVGLWLGLNDAVSLTYAADAATYQGYLQALWDQVKALLPGCTATLMAFRPHAADPASNATAIANVRAAYDAFETANADVTVINTDGYGLLADSVHYTAAANKTMGALLHG